ncbi:MAG: hypothetical protein EBT07_02315 [Actinobacteria bacterium]|nr:hypothetical protein [Actinomycetota bacterium]
MTLNTAYTLLGVLTSLGAILYGIKKAIKTIVINGDERRDAWDTFMRDWVGEEASPGRDAVPGVMERLNRLDGELQHNGGSSIKDIVVRMDQKFDVLVLEIDRLSERLDKIESCLQSRSDLSISPE